MAKRPSTNGGVDQFIVDEVIHSFSNYFLQFMDENKIREITERAIHSTLRDKHYNESQVQAWSEDIVENIMADLARLKKPYKFVAWCNILQNVGAGLQMAAAHHWDPHTDGQTTITWSSPYIHCTCHVFYVTI